MSIKRHLKIALNSIVGYTALAILRVARLADRNKTANVFAIVTRNIGPWLPQHRRGRENLRSAFPENPIKTFLTFCWRSGTTSDALVRKSRILTAFVSEAQNTKTLAT